MLSAYGDAMKRRSRAGGELTKGRRRKAPEPKRSNAPKPGSSSTPILETEVARLTRELNEAREQQTATTDVLQVISSFAGELDPVFQAILANATRICEAEHGTLFLFSDGTFQPVAAHGASAALPAVNLFHQLTRRQGLASGGLEGIPDRASNVSVPAI